MEEGTLEPLWLRESDAAPIMTIRNASFFSLFVSLARVTLPLDMRDPHSKCFIVIPQGSKTSGEILPRRKFCNELPCDCKHFFGQSHDRKSTDCVISCRLGASLSRKFLSFWGIFLWLCRPSA